MVGNKNQPTDFFLSHSRYLTSHMFSTKLIFLVKLLLGKIFWEKIFLLTLS